MIKKFLCSLVLVLVLQFGWAGVGNAKILTNTFSGIFDSGPLLGQPFTVSFQYDTDGDPLVQQNLSSVQVEGNTFEDPGTSIRVRDELSSHPEWGPAIRLASITMTGSDFVVWELYICLKVSSLDLTKPMPLNLFAGSYFGFMSSSYSDELNEGKMVFDSSTGGDLDADGDVDVTDAVLALQLLAGVGSKNVKITADLSSDGKIGMEECIYILQRVAGLRSEAHAEILTIPADGTTVYSSGLDAGQWYEIRAEGTYVGWRYMGMNLLADAEWRELQDHTWIEYPTQEYVHDLLINDAGPDWLGRNPDIPGAVFAPHTYSSNHVYTIYLQGEDQPLGFRIQDSWYLDNRGSLTVNITPAPAP